MTVTLADRQHSGNDPRWMSQRKIMLSFAAVISATFFRNRGNNQKYQHPIYTPIPHQQPHKTKKQTQEDRSSEGQRIAPILGKTTLRSDKLLTPLLAVKLRAQEWDFFNRSQHQTTSGPPESSNIRFHTKDWAFQWLPPLMWTGGVLKSVLVRSLCDLVAAP